MNQIFVIKGTVLSRIDNTGIASLRVEAWDKDLLVDDLLGAAITDAQGRFEIQFDERYYREICFDRRPDIYFKIYSGDRLVHSTEQSVLWNVSQPDVQVTISIDLRTSDEPPRIQPKQFVVRGRVARPDGVALSGVRVVAVDRIAGGTHGKEIVLGNTRTDAQGYYAIRYRSENLANPAKGSADLVVRVVDEQTNESLATSPLILNALEEEIINLSAGAAPYRGRSEFEFVAARLQPLLDDKTISNAGPQDIALLANQTGLTLEQVQLFIESQRQTGRAGLDAAILYALYRGGLPRSLAALTVLDTEQIDGTLQYAQRMHFIASLDKAAIADIVTTLHALGVKELLQSESPNRVHAASLLDLTKLGEQDKAEFLRIYTQNRGRPDEIWSALKDNGLGNAKIERVRRLFEFNALSLSHLPLVEQLAASKEIKSLRDLASKDTQAWKQYLQQEKIPAPEQLPGDTATEKQSNYALILGRLMEDAFPTVAFSSAWARTDTLDNDVAAFFQRNTGFAFESQGINAYLKDNPEALSGRKNQSELTYKLQAVQNLFRLAPRFERLRAVQPLWEAGLHSAHAIKRIGREKFVANYGQTIGAMQAQYIYVQAEKVAGFSLIALAKYAWDSNAITPYVIPKTDLKANPNDEARATLEALFGELDFCHCKHCRSVLGPAAYLVDVLLFLNNATANDGDTGLEKLFLRRPDIGNIKLNCENALTPLPYIDLVNEVLEDVIVPRVYTPETHRGTTVFNAEVNQTEEKRPEFLQASPEHFNTGAYERLKTAEYPFNLPFSLWAEEARVYLGRLGVRRDELMEVFSGRGADSPTAIEILCEALRITPHERGLLTTRVSDDERLKTLWGDRTGVLLSGFPSVTAFLQRAAITFAELEALLQCRFINPDPSGAIQISFDETYPCSLDLASLTNLNASKLDRLHRFIRLRKKLDWTFFDLDPALTAFGKTDIDDDFLEKCSLTVQLKQRLGVELPVALSWWSARIDTAGYRDAPSLYAGVFQNRALGEFKDDVRNTLALNTAGDELAVTDKLMIDLDYEPVILAATRLRKDELALIIANDLGGGNALNLASLSHVYRVASFTHAVGMPVGDYYLLKKLSGIQALSSTAADTHPRDTKEFLQAYETAMQSGITLAELAYLLAQDTGQPGHGRLSDAVTAQRLTEIRTALAAIQSAHVIPAENLAAVLAEKLGDLLEEEADRNTVLQIVLGASTLPDAAQKTFIDEYFSTFLRNITEAKDNLTPPVNALGDDTQARVRYVLEPLLAYLYPLHAQRQLEQSLSAGLSISVAAAAALLDVVRNPADAAQSAQDVLLEETFVTATDSIDATVYPDQFNVYERMVKAASILNALKIKQSEHAFAVTNGNPVGWLDFNDLPLTTLTAGSVLTDLFNRFTALVDAYKVWPLLRTGEMTLTEFLDTASAATESEIKQNLADNTAWSLDDIETLVGNYGYNNVAALRESAWLVQLYKAFSLLQRLGVRAEQAWDWNTADVGTDQAKQIKFAVKSRHGEKEWLSIAPVLRDSLREKQRDALLAHVIHEKDFKDADHAYEQLLIDPQMSACMDTSRIKQAIASAQLFVQRILMNLESEIEFTQADAKQWQWRKNYRVWEANRKVFLWPENWIYPDLRDDKSLFFKELEDTLSQSDIDDDSAEHALMDYLKKLDEVAQLEICGLYEETENATVDEGARHILHVVARTPSTPHRYFYRRWIDKRHWSAWEKVEADIEGDHLLPVVHNRRLFLFWPKFIEKSVVPPASEMVVNPGAESITPSDPKKYYEIYFAWTQYRDGKWRETQVSKDYFKTIENTQPLGKNKYYFFADRRIEGELLLYWRMIRRRGRTPGSELKVLHYNEVSDFLEGYQLVSTSEDPLASGRHTYLNKLPNSENHFMNFEKTGEERNLTLWTYIDIDDWEFGNILPGTEKKATLLTSAVAGFRLIPPHQYPHYMSQAPCFYADGRRVFFIEPRDVYQNFGGYGVTDSFTLPDESYFPEITMQLRDEELEFPRFAEPMEITGVILERPFFDGDAGYFRGNTASARVIDRGAGKSVGVHTATFAMQAGAGSFTGMDIAQAPTVIESAQLAGSEIDIDMIEHGIERQDFYNGLFSGWPVWVGKRYRFHAFYHPYVPLLIRQLNRYGVAGLLAPAREHGRDWEKLKWQQVTEDYFAGIYTPNPDVIDMPYPVENFDFSFGGAYSQYNWELFFHTPLLIAERLMQNQKFEEAQKWFHYIFDPTEVEGEAPKRFWKIRPFFEYDDVTSIEALLDLLNRGDEEAEAQVNAWENDPFNPHLIARMRVVAYMRCVVIKYLDNLIAWGDNLFRRDTLESINEATQIYVLAAQILGRKPERIEKTDVTTYTFNELLPLLDEFGNARVLLESSLPWMTSHRGSASSGASGILDTLYFCIPQNDKLLGYWDTVADRLFKLRNCMNIEGVRRQLTLFEPPIDPGLLVRARAAGLELSEILNDLNAPLPHYRFRVMLQKANEFCADVRALGGALLQALERRDEAGLALLRAGHQIEMLQALRAIKEKAIDEAAHNKEALLQRRQAIQTRHDFYNTREFMNAGEIAGVTLSSTSIAAHTAAVVADVLAGVMFLIPDFQAGASGFGGSPHVSVVTGGKNFGKSAERGANGMYQIATLLDKAAGLVQTIAAYQRRQDEWTLQRDMAAVELSEIEKQTLAAEIRIEITKADLVVHDQQVDHAGTELEYLESRFTNQELYNWMANQVSTLYFQAYEMAYDLAKKAEQCFRHELGVRDAVYIQFGYWDSLKQGLLAGERLQKDLRRLETAYLELNRREFELTKHVSLMQLNPLALLQLKQTGTCEFDIPEVVFDVDHPGHYLRRIKTVSLTIPCVTGPYTTIGAMLTMLENRIRVSTGGTSAPDGYRYTGLNDSRFAHDLVGVQSIATSSGQQDAGLFELSFGDERYLPFEGAGVISRWRLELPEEYRQFDYDTINDVIVHLRYTARDGGTPFRTIVQDELRNFLNRIANVLADEETGLTRIVSAAQEFSSEWHRFLYPAADAAAHRLAVRIDKRLFPFMLLDRRLNIRGLTAVMLLDDPALYPPDSGAAVPAGVLNVSFTIDGLPEATNALRRLPVYVDQPGLEISPPEGTASLFILDDTSHELVLTVEESVLTTVAPELIVTRDGRNRLNPEPIQDLLLVVNYTIENP